MAALSEITEEK